MKAFIFHYIIKFLYYYFDFNVLSLMDMLCVGSFSINRDNQWEDPLISWILKNEEQFFGNDDVL